MRSLNWAYTVRICPKGTIFHVVAYLKKKIIIVFFCVYMRQYWQRSIAPSSTTWGLQLGEKWFEKWGRNYIFYVLGLMREGILIKCWSLSNQGNDNVCFLSYYFLTFVMNNEGKICVLWFVRINDFSVSNIDIGTACTLSQGIILNA